MRSTNHVIGAGLFAVLAALTLIGIMSQVGAPANLLWIIAGHQMVANGVLTGWLWYVAKADDEMES